MAFTTFCLNLSCDSCLLLGWLPLSVVTTPLPLRAPVRHRDSTQGAIDVLTAASPRIETTLSTNRLRAHAVGRIHEEQSAVGNECRECACGCGVVSTRILTFRSFTRVFAKDNTRTTDNAETDLHLYTNASPDSARAVRVDFDPSVRPSSSPLQLEVGAVYPRVIQYCICEAVLQPGHGARSKHRV